LDVVIDRLTTSLEHFKCEMVVVTVVEKEFDPLVGQKHHYLIVNNNRLCAGFVRYIASG